MFGFTEVSYQLFRLPGRTLLMLLIAILLVASMGAYLGSTQASEAALDDLAQTVPVTARVLTRDGSKSRQLSVSKERYDALEEGQVSQVFCTVDGAAALDPALQAADSFFGGDTTLTAANCFEALAVPPAGKVAYLEGFDPDFLAGSEALCALSDAYADIHALVLGDVLDLPIYLTVYGLTSTNYTPLGNQTLRVAALYPATEANGERTPDMIVPANYLRSAAETANVNFSYASLSATVADPMRLNDFKDRLLSMGFVPVETDSGLQSFQCDAVSMEDELFIKTAEKLQENVHVYRMFRVPFFGLITLMIMLAVFLVLRRARGEMAIVSSLGEERVRIGLVHFSATMLVQLMGGCLGLLVLAFVLPLSSAGALEILATYLLCAALGTALALIPLFRVDTLTLLTRQE